MTPIRHLSDEIVPNNINTGGYENQFRSGGYYTYKKMPIQ